MRLLLDTNIFLEVLLDQEHAEEARRLLSQVEEHEFFASDFSLHSLGLLLFRRRQPDVFRQLLVDLFEDGAVSVIGLTPEEMEALIDAANRFHLDFDDAYQYAVAEHYALTIVSFDADFDRTERGRRTPDQVTVS